MRGRCHAAMFISLSLCVWGPVVCISNGIASRCCPSTGFRLSGPDQSAVEAATRFRCGPSASCIRKVDPADDSVTEKEFYFDEVRRRIAFVHALHSRG